MTKMRIWLRVFVSIVLPACTALPTAPPIATDSQESKGAGDDAVVASAPLPQASAQVLRPPAVTALLERARARRAAGQNDQAAVDLERALRIDPRDAEIWLELAGVNYEQGDYESAAQFAEKALRFAGEDASLRQRAKRMASDARLRGG